MNNLRKETLRILKNHNKAIEDIKFICSGDENIPIEMFFIKADREYDDGYGEAEVDRGLKIVGNDWWLERDEYDGSEWWVFKQIPRPNEKIDYTYSPFFDEWEI